MEKRLVVLLLTIELWSLTQASAAKAVECTVGASFIFPVNTSKLQSDAEVNLRFNTLHIARIKNGKLDYVEKRFIGRLELYNSSLTIRNLETNDSGVYTLEKNGDLGSEERFNLSVKNMSIPTDPVPKPEIKKTNKGGAAPLMSPSEIEIGIVIGVIVVIGVLAGIGITVYCKRKRCASRDGFERSRNVENAEAGQEIPMRAVTGSESPDSVSVNAGVVQRDPSSQLPECTVLIQEGNHQVDGRN